MAGFAFMDISKIKSRGQLTSKFIHNCRLVQIDNVIPEKTKENETLISLTKKSGKTLNYNEVFNERINSLEYYQNHNIRSNAVLGYEVLLTFTRDSKVDLNQWKKQSVDWLHKTFDVAPDGKSNVLHAELHMDEVGSPHIHAFVVPIDERGRLNAKRFTDGSRAMSALQSSYADSVKETGLKRGISGSSARHQDIRRMYANLNNAMVLPDIKKGETAEQYKERIAEQAKTAYARGMRDVDDQSAKMRREFDEQKNLEYSAIKLEVRRARKEIEHEISEMSQKKDALEEEVLSYETMVQLMLEQMAVEKMKMQDVDLEKNKELNDENAREFYKNMESGLAAVYEEDQQEAMMLYDEMEYLLAVGEQQRKMEEQQMNQQQEEFTDEMIQ